MEDKYSTTGAAIGVMNLFKVDPQGDLFTKAFPRPFRLFKGFGTNNMAWAIIGYTQNDPTTTFIGQC